MIIELAQRRWLLLLVLAITITTSHQFSSAYHLQLAPLRHHHANECTVTKLSTSSTSNDNSSDQTKLYFEIAIGDVQLGRLTFNITPPNHPHYLPLHTSNMISLASSQRQSIDPKATYKGCFFQHSPATFEDGSFRYRWGHVCEGNGRNGIQTTSATTGKATAYDDPFSDPERLMECKHSCFGGVYYGMSYEEILYRIESDVRTSGGDDGNDDVEREAVLLTVPIHGLGAGTSKFSIVRVSESPREWGERLLHNSAVIGYLDCSIREEDDGSVSSLDVLRAMARQRVAPPKIVECGIF